MTKNKPKAESIKFYKESWTFAQFSCKVKKNLKIEY